MPVMQKRILWSMVVRQLQSADISQKEIGAVAGMSQPMVSRLGAGKQEEPSYSEGEALKALFAQTFPGQDLPELATPTHPRADLALQTQGA